MKIKIFSCWAMVMGLATFVLWMSQGCVGGVPPVGVFVATSTPTLTPVPTPSYPLCSNVSTPTMIDDMEDNNNIVSLNQCRNGYWYSYNDGVTISPTGVQKTGGSTGAFTMGSPGVGYNGTGTSLHAVEVSTNANFNQYAGFGMAFTQPQANYNAYGYHGIEFYGKNTTGVISVAFQVTDNDVVVSNYTIGPHSINLILDVNWALYHVTMAQMAAAANTYGGPTVFDPSRIQQIQFAVGPGIATDVWIDNLSFY